ncbi:MAG: hypothetical protein Ct9H300mP16_07700 [Pseudomonadota bacterium]|nr:MAG: hypothetical protein Ct9H300mP16_07700 [Pseudomonadota bacterium]
MAEIDNEPGTRGFGPASSLYGNSPTDSLDQPEFINAVVRINCTLEPAVLRGTASEL